jgi:hypothetical protein
MSRLKILETAKTGNSLHSRFLMQFKILEKGGRGVSEL